MGARGEKRWTLVAIPFVVAWACGGKIEPATDAEPSSSAPSATSSSSPPSHVHTVSCGDALCSVPADECCLQDDSMECSSPSSQPSCTGARIACDEPADCPPAYPVCCWIPSRDSPYGWSSQCADSCIRDSLAFEACTTDSDCKESPGPCTTHVCSGHTYRFCQAVTQLCSP